MIVESVAKEGIQLAEFLREHLHHRKIIALCHSWGTMIGVHMIHDRPDLFSAYVGIGQMSRVSESESLSDSWALQQARAKLDVEPEERAA